MFALFPGILFLAPFSATILRFGAGLSFIYVGYKILADRNETAKIRMPLVDHAPMALIWIAGVVTALDGFALLMGFGTQAAAIIGMLIALKHFFLTGRYAAIRPLPRSTYALLFLICLTLLISGAGPIGLDLPL